MRVLMLSKACVVGAYQRKLEEIAACPEVALTVAVPPEWRDERGTMRLERAHTQGYELAVTPMAFNGSFHLHFYPGIDRLIARVRPDIVHIDEEPYNFATWHALRLARRRGAKVLFFSWQNLLRRYPFPFSYFERVVLKHAHAAIVGNRAAMDVWRAKGYRGPVSVIPQFGVDPEIFRPHSPPLSSAQGRGEGGGAGVGGEVFTVGYAGRLVPEKGVDVLLRAVAQLPDNARVHLAGSGPERNRLLGLAAQLGLRERVTLDGNIASMQMPGFYSQLDCLVLPSRSRPNWIEQFGRVLVEAMACGVPVVGSTCGELPNVIGDAGLTFPEGEVDALSVHLHELMNNPGLRASLAVRGRARALERYTQKRVAQETVAVYRQIANGG
jgi:glycosyltransferase involved in cell wall biosynthesis